MDFQQFQTYRILLFAKFDMSLLLKIGSYFGGKIQMWLKSVLENLTFKLISPLPKPIICTLSVLKNSKFSNFLKKYKNVINFDFT